MTTSEGLNVGRQAIAREPDFLETFLSALRVSVSQVSSQVSGGSAVTIREKLMMRQLAAVVKDFYSSMEMSEETPNLAQYVLVSEGDPILKALREIVMPISSLKEAVTGVANVLDSVYSRIAAEHGFDLPLALVGESGLPERFEVLTDGLASLRNKIDAVQIEESAESAQAGADSAVTSADLARESSGVVGEVELAHYFDRYSTSQVRNMWGLRAVAVVLLGLAFLVARDAVYGSTGSVWQYELARLALTTPILYLAYMSIREASHHRDASQRAKETAVRLKTLHKYAQDLTEPQKYQLRFDFGQRVFNETTPLGMELDAKDAQGLTPLIAALTTLVGVAKKP